MDEKRLDYFREKLRLKALSLTEMIQRSSAYGREKDRDIQDIADQALESYTTDFNFSKNSSDRHMLLLIRQALQRIEDESFGCCAHCEELIEPKRLEAVPWAPYCLRCQSLAEKGRLDG